MKIGIENQSFDYFPYWIVPQGGERDADGNRSIKQVALEIWKGSFSFRNTDLEAIIFTSDLQGVAIENGEHFLLGERLPSFLKLLIEVDFPHINSQKIGVCLCGDLYANLEKRGGLGDVRMVWQAFKKEFNWVAGVAGNHDAFGTNKDLDIFKRQPNLHFLQHEVQKVGNLEIGGISGIIGNNTKPHRLLESDFLKYLKHILLKQPDIVLLHQGPDYPTEQLEGEANIRTLIQNSPTNLIVCGHCHWDKPLISFDNGSQILNVDGRAVILLKDASV